MRLLSELSSNGSRAENTRQAASTEISTPPPREATDRREDGNMAAHNADLDFPEFSLTRFKQAANTREEVRLRELIYELYELTEEYVPLQVRAQFLLRLLRSQSQQPLTQSRAEISRKRPSSAQSSTNLKQ
jgi:hypothetical protein